MKARLENLLKLRMPGNIKANMQKRTEVRIETIMTAQKERRKMKNTLKYKPILSLLASLAFCLPIGAQHIEGAVFGGGQNADVEGNTYVTINPNPGSKDVQTNGATVYDRTIVWDGTNDAVWKPFLDADGKYDFKTYGMLYVDGGEFEPEDVNESYHYVDGSGNNALIPTVLPAGKYTLVGKIELPNVLTVHGMLYFANSVTGKDSNNWAPYCKKVGSTYYYDFLTYGPLYVNGEKQTFDYVDANGENCLNITSLDNNTTYSMLTDVICVAGGGENGNVLGNSAVEVKDGVFGYECEELKKNVGKILGGGLMGTVGTRSDEPADQMLPGTAPKVYMEDYDKLNHKTNYPNYSSVTVDGNYVDVYGDVFAGGYGADVFGSTFLTLNHGYLCRAFGGGVQADVVGRSHVMLSENYTTTSTMYVSRFNRHLYANTRVDDQTDLKLVEQEGIDNVYTGRNIAAVGAPILVIGGSVYGGGAYGQVGTSLTEADVKAMAAATITMNAGYLGYLPGLGSHHAEYAANHFMAEMCTNPYTLYENEYNATSGCIFGGGYGGSTSVPTTKITVNSGYIAGAVYGGGEKGDIGLVVVPADKVDKTSAETLDHFRRCKGVKGEIEEIPVGTVPAATDGYIYFSKIFADPFAEACNVSDIQLFGNTQYMVRYKDERADKNYRVTRVNGAFIYEQAQGLMENPRNTATDELYVNPTPYLCGFRPERNGSYYIYDKTNNTYVEVYDKFDGWITNIEYEGKKYDAGLFSLKGKDGATDRTLKPEDYYDLTAVVCLVGGGFEGDAFGHTNLKIHGGSYGTTVEAEQQFEGCVVGGGFNGFVTGNASIYIDGYSDIFGNVYGGGVNGNVDGNTYVDVRSGFMRNVFGGGMYSSVGWYKTSQDEKHGNTFVTIDPQGEMDPHTQTYDKIFVSQSVYGGGAYGIVRTNTNVKVTGGRIGYMPDYDVHSAANMKETGESNYYEKKNIRENTFNDDEGNIFGAGLGSESVVLENTNVDVVSSDVKNSIYLTGSVYGGGKQGCVGMGYAKVYYIVDQNTFNTALNWENNANKGYLYKFVNGETVASGKNGYIRTQTYQPGVQYYMAVMHQGDTHKEGDCGNTNVNVAANVESNVDGKMLIHGAVIGGSRGYNTIFEANVEYTKVEAQYLGYVLGNTKVKVGSGGETSESSIEIHGSDFYIFSNTADKLTSLNAPGEYNNYYFQNRASVFYAMFQHQLVDGASYYTKEGSDYKLVETPNQEDLAKGLYYMGTYTKDYVQINPDVSTPEATAAALAALKQGHEGRHETARLYVLETIYSVVGGGEDGVVVGNTQVDVTNGSMGYQNEDVYRRMGDVIAGGLNGDVIGYTRLNVNGEFVYIMGECYGGGYNGVVQNTTLENAERLANAAAKGEELPVVEPLNPIAAELLFQKGMACDIFGGSCYTPIPRGNTYLQIGEKPAEGKAGSPDRLVVVSQSAYGGSCYAALEGESSVDMYNGIIGYSRARPIKYYNPKFDVDDPLKRNDVLNKDRWLTTDNNGNETENYGKANYWWPKDFSEGNVFGAGYGAEAKSLKSMVNIYGGRIRNSVYGGGELGDVGKDENDYISTSGADLSAGNYQKYKKSGDAYVKAVDGDYYRPIVSTVNIKGGLIGDCVVGGGKGEAPVKEEDANTRQVTKVGGTSATIFGGTMVNITGGEWILREELADYEADPYLCNTYAGCRFNGNVYGDTFLNIEKTMCGSGVVKPEKGNMWHNLYTTWYSYKMCVYGGGYGEDTNVEGNTNVLMDVKDFQNSTDITYETAHETISPYPWQSVIDVVGGGFEGSVNGSTYVTIDGKSFVRNVYGGGFFAPIGTRVENDTQKASYPNTTNVLLKAGSFESIYGGGFLSDVNGESKVTYGVYGEANDHLFTRLNLFGGNNVSGDLAGSQDVNFGTHVNIYGGTIGNEKGYVYINRGNLGGDYDVSNMYYQDVTNDGSADEGYLPVHNGDKYDENLFRNVSETAKVGNDSITITRYYLKEVDGEPIDIQMFERVNVGNVYGAGNGDYPGFYEDGLMAKETGYSYVGRRRPNVASSKINIVGTKDHIAVINGAVFGGGNASTVGFTDPRKPYIPRLDGRVDAHLADKDTLIYYPDYTYLRNTKGNVQINIGGYTQIKELFLGSNGECLINNIGTHVYKIAKKDPNGGKPTDDVRFSGFINAIDFGRYMDIAAMSCVPKLTFNAPEEGKEVFADDNNKMDATDITIGSFYVGGNIGSMVANQPYEYTLPEGVTVVDRVVGGSNDASLKFIQLYSPYPEGSTFNGGTSSVPIAPKGTVLPYLGGVSMANNSFIPEYRNKPKVKLNLLCKFEPNCSEKEDENGNKYFNFEGSMVFGGCYTSGVTMGDVEIFTNSDFIGSRSAKQYINDDGSYDEANFFPTIKGLLASAKDFDQQWGTIFGGGYGKDTEVRGNTKIDVKATGTGSAACYPVLNRVFGGSDFGTVSGNTNITFDAGTYGCTYGKVYGGGYYGLTGKNTNIEINSGSLIGGVYGGACMADVGGSSYVNVKGTGRVIMESLYGGCDISGEVKGKQEFTSHDGETVNVNSFIRVSEVAESADKYTGFPFIGQLYGGSDGHYSEVKNGHYTDDFTNPLYGNQSHLTDVAAPRSGRTYLDITGGTMGNVYAGGNNVTVDGEVHVNFDNRTEKVAIFEYSFLREIFLYLTQNHINLYSGYQDDGQKITMKYQVCNMFGGNNIAPMYIQPQWKLTSGTIENLYSGGNRGAMHYYNAANNNTTATGTPGIELKIESDDISVDNVYGGCRMADVKPYVIEKGGVDESNFGTVIGNGELMVEEDGMIRQCMDEKYDTTKEYYVLQDSDERVPKFAEGKYGAVLNIVAGKFENVYGGNDVSGVIYEGTNVNVSGAISGNVYGAGNGNYLYECSKDVEQITEVDHPEDPNLPVLYFKIPFYGESDAEKIAAVNAARPNVSKSFLNVTGKEGRVAYVKGNVFCGGNASTILTNKITGEATSLFKIGNYVTINGVYLGSDGQTIVDGTMLENFKKLNKINTLSTKLSEQEIGTYGVDCYKDPTLLTLYMQAVETRALPLGFKLNDEIHHANIGTFCCGGNRGSVATAEPIDLTFPTDLNIFKHIIGGCNNANFKYDGATHIGGFVAKNSDSEKDKEKIHFTVKSHFVPKVMDVDNGKAEDDYLIDAAMTEDEYRKQTLLAAGTGEQVGDTVLGSNEKVYPEICNVYGGCYLSGYVYGKVGVDMHSNQLENVDLAILDKTNKDEIPCFSVFGGGYGATSWNLGGVELTMHYDSIVKAKVKADAPIKTAPVVNNLYGGGQLGNVVGNATLKVTSGEVYNDVVGGALAGYLYGSTQILVGYPQYYVCTKTGIYKMKRGDTSEDNLNLENVNLMRDPISGQYKRDTTTVLRQEVRYVEGDLVPANIYQMIKDYDGNTGNQAANFRLEENEHTKWTDEDNIWIRKGVYGGGYARVNGGNVYAGSYTVCKYINEHNLADLTGDENDKNLTYGGNSAIMVSDDRSKDSKQDHITISSEVHREVKLTAEDDQLGYYLYDESVTESDNKYTHLPTGEGDPNKKYVTFDGEGGIYGDGRMVFAEGVRAVDIYNYGYARYTPQHPKLLNTFQRCDVVSVTDCCMQLQGAKDFATNSVDATTYAITRIMELRMNSTIDANTDSLMRHTGNNDVLEKRKARNYIGLFNNIHYLGSIVSNASFDDNWHEPNGTVSEKTYRQYKQDYIDAYVAQTNIENPDNSVYENFKKRNVGTAKNLIGINNGYCLKIQNCYTTVDDMNRTQDNIYYGPVVGVVEVRLLTLIPGEGGGYIYADNVHESPEAKFMNVSGNFVFPGMAHTQGIAPQHIVDDCFPIGFYNDKGIDAPKDEQVHYWFVEGNLYFYNATITGYSYTPPTGDKELNFDMNNVDQIITLSGTTPKPHKVVLKSVRWHSQHDTSDGYECDLENFKEKTGYELLMSVSGEGNYNPAHVADGSICYYAPGIPRQTDSHKYDLTKDKIDADPTGIVGEFTNTDKIDLYSPSLSIRLRDTEINGGRDYYHKHLDQPDLIQLIIQSEVDDPEDNERSLVYTYVINLTVKYVLGPRVTGTIHVNNCALPGEVIHVSKENVNVEADETMPVTNSNWKILPKVKEGVWTDRLNGLFVDQYVNPNTGNLELPAKYMYDDWKVEYYIVTSNYDFPVEAPLGDHLKVHNYHRMQKVASLDENGKVKPQLDVVPGSRIYIQDATDLERFRMYVDYCKDAQTTLTAKYQEHDTEDNAVLEHDYVMNPNNCEGLKFYFQNNLAATEWTNPTNEFKGEINGDGYVVDLSKAGEGQKSLLAKNSGDVYNLGVVGGHVATDNAGLIMNSFSYGTDVAGSNSGSGKVANSYQNAKPTGGVGVYAKDAQFNDGTVAYNLNQYYLEKRYSLRGAEDQVGSAYEKKTNDDGETEWKSKEAAKAYQYVLDYYKNGDYRYAKVRGSNGDGSYNEYLRSENIPNYDNGDKQLSTFHYSNHKADDKRARYESADGNALQKDSTATFVLNEPIYPDDYIFFGQKLLYGNSVDHNKYPVHINRSTDEDVNNRVYRVSGFYGSKQDQGVHFNHRAALYNPELTAVDFTCQRDKELGNTYIQGYPTDAEKVKLQKVWYAPAEDYDGIRSFTIANPEISRNLLVYTSKEGTSTEYKLVDEAKAGPKFDMLVNYDQKTKEDKILAHHMLIENEGTSTSKATAKVARGLFHLVDKQDFNCPISFDVDTRAWYERQPDCLNEGHNDGWESICLPFTVKKVTATQVDRVPADGVNYFNHGEITHFYGKENDKKNYDTEAPTDVTKFNTDQNQVGHEYWLRGFTGYQTTDKILNFMRPTGSGEGGFFDDRIAGTSGSRFDYVYENKYLPEITDAKNAYSYYDTPHTYKDYMPLTANVPYIVSYPGTYFYEFNMQGEKMTYENPNVTVGVSDDGNQVSIAGGYEYYGTFKRLTPTAEKPYYFCGSEAKKDYPGDCFMLSDVTKQDGDGNVFGTIYPFRGYFNVAKSSNAQKYLPFSLKRMNNDNPTSPADEIGALKIWTDGKTLCVDSPEDMILKMYSVNGILMKNLDVKKGSNRFTVEMPGVYVVNNQKYKLQ